MLLAVEHSQQAGLDGILGGKIDAERVDVLLIFVEFEMQMGAGTSAGGTHVTDDLALSYFGAVADSIGEIMEVSVAGHIPRVMLQVDSFTVMPIPAGLGNYSIAHGAHRCASFGGEIDTGVRDISF